MSHPEDSPCPIAEGFPEGFGKSEDGCPFGTSFSKVGDVVVCHSGTPGYHRGLETTGNIQCNLRDIPAALFARRDPDKIGALAFLND